MNYNHVSKKLIINTSGSAGSGGRDGRDGSSGGYYHGNDGSDGENGSDGTHARDININLHADDQAGAVVVQNKNEVCALPLGDAEVAIITKASGGNGGNGGGGGDGARGIDGYSGTDATMYSSGTNGGNGTNGGDGGDGGNGGNGGNGADVTIAVKHTDTDLLMLFAEPEMAGGAAGRGGRRGDGGRGGAGGRGGSGFSWSEPVYHTHVDHDGCSHTDVSYIYHSLPGGSNGCYGASGSDGQNGRDGVRGKDGKLTINVDDGHSYQGFYNLSLRSINHVQSDDGIIEPGETLAVSGVTFANTGLMPTPEHQAVQVSLSPNKWVRFHPRDTATLPGSISEGSSRTVTEAVKFSLNPSSAPHVIDTTFHETGNLQFHARMARVNKEFDRIPQQTYSIDIRYPVEISTVAIPPVIARGEEAPFIVKIRNVSTKPIGISADDSRLLEVKLSAANDNNSILQLIDAETSQAETLVTPAIHTVNLLGAGETAYFTGAIKFSQSTPAYTNAKLNYKLYLGALENPAQKQHVIQQRNIQLQLAERYVHDENADMVLVTNNHTKPETVAQWIEKAKMMGTTINVWNTSLYSGLSYTQKRKDQQNFISQMQGKVIIILNNEMNIENKNTYSTDCLDAMEILEAAKNSNVSTYVVGGHYNLKNAITPLMRNSNDAVYTINEKYFFWRRPKHEDLLKQAAEINKRLQKDHPEQRFVPVVNFAPERITKGKYYLRPTWELGTVETRETLGQSQAHIALRQAGADEFLANHADIFNVLKLMPFARKLQYLDAAVQRSDDAAAKIISVAILSDLTDELMTYAKDKWNGGFSKAKLASALVNLKMMSEHAFVPSQHLNMILTNYDYIAKRLPTNYDKFLFPFWCRRIRLRNVSHQTIEAMMHHYFPANQFNFYNQNLENLYNKLPREELFERYASPYKNDVTFDNHVNVSEPVLEAALPAYQKKNSYFSERFNLFASSSDRNKFIETQKSNCKFEL